MKKWTFYEEEDRILEIVTDLKEIGCSGYMLNREEMFERAEKMIAMFLDLEPENIHIEDDFEEEKRNFIIKPSKDDGRSEMTVFLRFEEFEDLNKWGLYQPPYTLCTCSTRAVRDKALEVWENEGLKIKNKQGTLKSMLENSIELYDQEEGE